jgi:hypothetical protein
MQVHAQKDFASLSSKFLRAQTDYERARLQGDDERLWHSRLRLAAITSERDHLIEQLGGKMSRQRLGR